MGKTHPLSNEDSWIISFLKMYTSHKVTTTTSAEIVKKKNLNYCLEEGKCNPCVQIFAAD